MIFKWLVLVFVLELQYAQTDGIYPRYSMRTRLYGSCSLPKIKNGRAKVRNLFNIVRFTCFSGYELLGNRYVHCINDHWDSPLPVCIRPGCESPQVENGLPLEARESAYFLFFCMPGYQLQGSSALYCDGEKWNASAPICAPINTTNSTQNAVGSNLSCDFEQPDICGWKQDEAHDFDWTRLNKRPPSFLLYTGPSFDHTHGQSGSGYFMYIESSAKRENDSARLVSPIYDKSLVTDGCFSFFYHMYGRTIGGLRVYQKPDRIDLKSLLKLNPAEKAKYVLFEQWGDHGDAWYRSVSNLTDVSDDFQIVIEGIRGKSFTSDIAIDDVAILQGANCTEARETGPFPQENIPDSCAGRCNQGSKIGCSCNSTCLVDLTCCGDFFDLCYFTESTTPAEEASPSTRPKELPQTQKLVGTTPEIKQSVTTTPKPIEATTQLSTTTSTTTKATPLPTTAKTPKATTVKPVTTQKLKLTTAKSTMRPTTMAKSTTKTVTSGKPMQVTTVTIETTMIVSGISRTFENHDTYHELVEKAKAKQELEGIKTDKLEENKGSTSHVKVTVIVISSLLAIMAAAYAAMYLNSERGRSAIARLQGRARADPEVRFLTSEADCE